MDTQQLNLDESVAKELLRYVFGESVSDMVISNYIEGFKKTKLSPKWMVYTKDGINYKAFTLYQIESGSCDSNDPNWNCFKTEQEAKDFIVQNKPCFSAKDIKCIIFGDRIGGYNPHVNDTIDRFAKEKISL